IVFASTSTSICRRPSRACTIMSVPPLNMRAACPCCARMATASSTLPGAAYSIARTHVPPQITQNSGVTRQVYTIRVRGARGGRVSPSPRPPCPGGGGGGGGVGRCPPPPGEGGRAPAAAGGPTAENRPGPAARSEGDGGGPTARTQGRGSGGEGQPRLHRRL